MMGRPKTETKRSLLPRLISLSLLAVALLLLLAGTALAADTTTTTSPATTTGSTDATASFSLEPSSPSSHPSGYFIISGTPGQAVKDSVVMRNLTEQTITVSLAAVDGATGLYGGITYGLPTDPVKNVGSWITLSQTTVTLKPLDMVQIPFTVNVPNDAPSGTNVGAITAWIPAADAGSTTTSEGFGAQIIIQTRRVLAVQVDLPGDTQPLLQITGLTPTPRSSGMNLDIGIANTGHGLASGTGSIDIPSTGFHKDFKLESVLPGTSLAYPIPWSDNPDAKTYDATVTISYNGKTADWSGTFQIGETAVSELQNYQTSTTLGGQKASATLSRGTIIAIAVGAVAWLIVVGVGTYFGVRAARRRRAAKARRSGDGFRPWMGDRS
jgi:hypothetical protein